MLAHELRNPLAPIRNAVQVLRRVDELETSQRMREIIGSQIDHLTRLVDDLLDVTRITHGKVPLRIEPTDLIAVVSLTIEPLRPLFAEHGIDLTIATGAAPIWVMADPARLQQVLANLLQNALKYTDSGGRVSVETNQEADEVVIRVRDSGIGISGEMIPRIFDPFSQADVSLDRSRGGLGVGLTLARRLVQMHGGELIANSPGLGLGSEFVIRLPGVNADGQLIEIKSETAASISRCDSDRNARPPILVVDDNVDAAHSLSVLLKLWGHETHIVHDGSAAIEAALEIHPRVVLLDIGLPKLDGYEVARTLRSEPKLTTLKIVAMTGYGQAEDRRKSRDAGFDIHLVKPVDLDQLEAILSESVARG